MRQDYAVLWGIGTVALIVGGLGVMASMLTSIRQRSREIALRIAVGARRRDILQQFVVEALVVATVGAVVGALLTLTSLPVISALFQVTIVSASWVVPTAMGVAVAVGMASGVIPAVRASKVDPTQSLVIRLPFKSESLFQFTALSLASERRNASKTATARRELRQCSVDGTESELREIGDWLAFLKRPEEEGQFTVLTKPSSYLMLRIRASGI